MSDDEKPKFFHEMELDDRILKGIAKLGWVEPTLIQEKSIPLLLEGKDVLCKARTGSGKTGAFAIPVIQKIINSKKISSEQQIKALVLAPSKELCNQIYSNFIDLSIKCSRDVRIVDISAVESVSTQKPLLIEKPDIVIATPTRALVHLKANTLNLKKSLEFLVIDEADLIFSFGYEDDIKEVLSYLPRVYQAVLASATLSTDVTSLKKLVLHNAVILKLEEPDIAPASQLQHYHLMIEENEKAAILYALLKLHLIRGKSIIFVNTVDKCYKLRIFLEQFGIPSCVLNSELPSSIRCHTVSQFNKGIYDIIIASDEKSLEQPEGLIKSKRKKDKESGVSRGIDFHHVSNVINFDFPLDVSAYIHRVGRTARGKNSGTALSFVSISELFLKEEVEARLRQGYDEDEEIFKLYQFKMEQLEGFRYRANDAWRAVTRIAIREARLKELKEEMLNSQKLKTYFEENPKDLATLRHDKALHIVKLDSHLKHVPEYIVPSSLKQLAGIKTGRKRKQPILNNKATAKGKFQAKTNNPLLCMDVMNKNKEKKRKLK